MVGVTGSIPVAPTKILYDDSVWLDTAKVILCDTMLEWRTTAPIRGTVAEWMGMTIAFFFGRRMATSIARMALTRLAMAGELIPCASLAMPAVLGAPARTRLLLRGPRKAKKATPRPNETAARRFSAAVDNMCREQK